MKISFTFVLLFISTGLFSQKFGNIIVNEITIEAKGIQAVSKNNSDTIITEMKSNSILYCFPDSSISFWHKIYVNTDCEITFTILPSRADNIYNYFLYEDKIDLNVEDVLSEKINPIRANLFKGEMYVTGTGLSVASCVTVQNSCSNDPTKDFYHTAFHSAVKAKKGEVLLLNIYHVQGDDCGYLFTLNAGKHSQKFQSLFKTCYSKQLVNSKVQRSVNQHPFKKIITDDAPIAKEKVPVIEKAVFIVRDSAKHIPVDAEISFVKKQNDIAPSVSQKTKGEWEFVLEKNKEYHLVFSAMGYKNVDVYFITNDSIRSFTNDVYLSRCREGENFVMDKIYFEPNRYAMKEGAYAELDKLTAYLKNNPGVNIEIQGHTNGNKRIKASYKGDFKGSAKKLSQGRADKIKKYLTDNGIAAERLMANGYGGSKPIFPEPKNQAQANKNIRVEILILSQKESVAASVKQKK